MVSNSYSLGMPTGNKRIPKPRISGNDGLHRGNHYLLVIQCIYIYTTYILLCNTAHLVEWFAIESGDFQRVAMFSNSLTYGSIYRSEIGNINPLHAFLGVLISISLFHFVECGWMLWPYGQLNMVGTQNGRSITVAPLILLDYSYLIYILLCFASSFLFCKKPLACFGKTETITSPGFKIQCFEGGSKVRDIYDGNRVFERCWWDQAHI